MNIVRSFRIKSFFVLVIVGGIILAFLTLPTPAIEPVKSKSVRTPKENTVWLSSLNLSKMTSGWGKPEVDKSVQNQPMSIAGQKFDRGVGTHANSIMYIDLKRGSKRFSAYVGVDDEVNGPRRFASQKRSSGGQRRISRVR